MDEASGDLQGRSSDGLGGVVSLTRGWKELRKELKARTDWLRGSIVKVTLTYLRHVDFLTILLRWSRDLLDTSHAVIQRCAVSLPRRRAREKNPKKAEKSENAMRGPEGVR